MGGITLTAMFIVIMESQDLEFVENFLPKCTAKLVESIKPKSISFLANLFSSGGLIFPRIGDIACVTKSQHIYGRCADMLNLLSGPDL